MQRKEHKEEYNNQLSHCKVSPCALNKLYLSHIMLYHVNSDWEYFPKILLHIKYMLNEKNKENF